MIIDLTHIPDGKSGPWEINTMIVEEDTYIERPNEGPTLLPKGEYKSLLRDGLTIMNNVPQEIHDFIPFINQASGSIFITGLGLGVIIQALLKKDDVTHITVLDNSQDVIDLVAPYYTDPRVRILYADAFTWIPDRLFDYGWHDIWDTIIPENIPEMLTLEAHYNPYITVQECWAKHLC